MVRKIAHDTFLSVPQVPFLRNPDLVSGAQNVLSDIVLLDISNPESRSSLLLCVLLREMHTMNLAVILSYYENFHVITFRRVA